MRLLLDTHALLWYLGGSDKLSARARAEIESPGNTLLFSLAGAWEIAIKLSLGKLHLSVPFERLIPGELRANGIELLPISAAHAAAIVDLPMHHRDPFDRMLVVQGVKEGRHS
ncbi:MAG: PilT protein domain protein [Gemmatimonadetes bacterium]|nr:PilT protein domain protein [Gemmatimonadota bacterium]